MIDHGQLMLPSSDPVGLAACMASVPDDRQEDGVKRHRVANDVAGGGTNWGMKRTLLSYRFHFTCWSIRMGKLRWFTRGPTWGIRRDWRLCP